MISESFPLTIKSTLSKHQNTLFLIITIITGITILWPLHDFQYYLAQGDHGRDLYCFKKAMEGAIPYKDFSWLFGPLMPYYYSIFYFFGGVSIQSVLLGQLILILLTGIFVYMTCTIFFPPTISFICALWYWCFRGTEFFYTYNHSGGMLALIVTLYCLFKYIHNNRLIYVVGGFVSIFLFTLIRLNMGISTLIAFLFILVLTDIIQKNPAAQKRRNYYTCLTLIVLSGTFLLYWMLVHTLPSYALSQSFPYSKVHRADFTPSLLDTLILSKNIIIAYFSATWTQRIFGIFLFLSIVQTCILIFSNRLSLKVKNNYFLILSALLLLIFLNSHEFFASGVFYRIYWFFPLIIISVFTLVSIATTTITPRIIKFLILYTLFLPPLFNQLADYRILELFKNPKHMFHIGKNKIYTTQHPIFIKTVTDATMFIKENVPKTDKILALPLDPLYLFLSGRDSATRQLVFFDHFNITEEQENETISEMESNNGNWVLISNRSVSSEGGMGTFGETYCPILAQYIKDHFTVVAEFGDWVNPPGWAWNHGVRIYKRIK